jgi:hypothetical protein
LIHPLPSMVECHQQVLNRAGLERADVALQGEIRTLCASELSEQGRLNDFQLRRMAYFQQDYAGSVVLWMVVVITISGVILAGLQLAASYNLAASGRSRSPLPPEITDATATDQPSSPQGSSTLFIEAGHLEVQKDRLILRSSITGLFILVVSFAFFLVFVTEVYRLRGEDPDRSASTSQISPNTPRLWPGGPGHVPDPAGKNTPVPSQQVPANQ